MHSKFLPLTDKMKENIGVLCDSVVISVIHEVIVVRPFHHWRQFACLCHLLSTQNGIKDAVEKYQRRCQSKSHTKHDTQDGEIKRKVLKHKDKRCVGSSNIHLFSLRLRLQLDYWFRYRTYLRQLAQRNKCKLSIGINVA